MDQIMTNAKKITFFFFWGGGGGGGVRGWRGGGGDFLFFPKNKNFQKKPSFFRFRPLGSSNVIINFRKIMLAVSEKTPGLSLPPQKLCYLLD